MWAFGVMLFLMITGQKPFSNPEQSPGEFLYEVRHGDYDLPALEDVQASPELRDLIANLLRPVPETRLTASQALAHAFYASVRDPADVVKAEATALTGVLDVDSE
jgi:serine/threonine protein kinase